MVTTPLAIETTNLTKRFRQRTAVAEVSLAVPQGAIYGLLGHSGAGKTTLARILGGRLSTTNGTLRLFGDDVSTREMAVSSQAGFVAARPAFYPHLSGRDNLRVLARAIGYVEPQWIATLLAMLGLEPWANLSVRSYTQSLRQRLGIAAAMLHQPRLLVLDEPDWHLDQADLGELHDVLYALVQAKHTIVLTSRLLETVLALCSHVALMDKGRVLLAGRVTELVGVQSLLIDAEPLPLVHVVAEQLGAVLLTSVDHRIHVAFQHGDVSRLVAALVHAGATIHAITPGWVSLEQRYAELERRVQRHR